MARANCRYPVLRTMYPQYLQYLQQLQVYFQALGSPPELQFFPTARAIGTLASNIESVKLPNLK